MEETTPKDTKTGVLERAKSDFKMALEAWDHNRKAWLDDAKFLALDQWPDDIRKLRSIPGQERPCLTVDKLNQYKNQVVNDGRQNRPAVKVRPVDGEGDPKVAEAFQGIIRHICDRSRADQAFDTALSHAVGNGYGFFRITTEYAHEKTFNQEIRIKRVRNPLSVLLDPNAQEADGSDAAFGFFIDEMTREEFKRKYPKATFTDWEDQTKWGDGWAEGKNVRVCEYFYKENIQENMLLLVDGTTVSEEAYWTSDKNGGEKVEILESRMMPSCKVKWARLTGAEILEENDWLGKYIPIIPVYGNEEDIEGKVYYSSLIRKAKDAQRLYNFSRSAFAERVAMSPKAPFMAADESVDGKDEWETANSGNHQVLRFKAFDEAGNPLPTPQRVPPSDIPAGYAQDMQISEHDIQGALGMYNASLGEKSNEKSGRAITARQREADTGTFHFQDNQARAIGYLGLQLVDLIPKVIDSRRAIRILGEDGKAQSAMVDPEQEMAVSKGPNGVPIYNLNAGQYDVSVAAGPSYTTKRQESVEAMMQLTQSAPEFLQVAGDIMVRNMDWPGAEEIADRMKLMLPPQVLQAENSDEDPKVQAVKAQAQQVIDQANQQIEMREQALAEQGQELERVTRELENEKAANALKAQEIEVKKYEAETERMLGLAPAVPAEQVAAIVQQTVQEIVNMPVPMPPPMELAPEPMEQPIEQPPSGGFFPPEGM